MMNRPLNVGLTRILVLGCWMSFALAGFASAAQAGTISQIPLPTAASAKPNIMLLLDNSGSMNNIVPDKPFDASVVYLETCPASNLVPAASQVELRLVGGQPRIFITGQTTTYPWGTGTDQRCFGSNSRYLAKLTADGGTAPSAYLPAEYPGNFLNWYFQAGNTDPVWNSSSQQKKPGTFTRMEVAKGAASALLDTLGGVRVGLATYNNGNGAKIEQGVTDISSGRADLKAKVNALVASGSTPLAEALRDLGDYFAQGQNGSLLLYRLDKNKTQSVSKNTLFARGYTFTPPSAAPIQYFCQKNFALLMTDGRPTNDNDIASVLRDYDGDCQNASPVCLSEDRKPAQSYENTGTDYLDDVAAALRDIDLRPDLSEAPDKPVVNNLITYTIGFADDQVINDPLMRDTAANGGGQFLTAANAEELNKAFAGAANFILSNTGSAAAVAVNGPRLKADGDNLAFQAIYNSGSWTGELIAYNLDPKTGAVVSVKWRASENLSAFKDRNNFYTWNPGESSTNPNGVLLIWDNLTAAQKQALEIGPTGVADGRGAQRLAYLRGDTSAEGDGADSFRPRNSLLGDIVNGDPVHVGNQNYGYDQLPGAEGSKYPGYRAGEAKERPAMVYAGANDGFLHGFEAASGKELFAYMPAAVLTQANQLTFPQFKDQHRFFVDGPPRANDAYIGDDWRTYLLGSLGAGGKSIFALDVTDPKSFSASDIKWEFSDAADLGFTFSQPTVARLENGKWVAIFGNGYQSSSNKAGLFVLDLANGTMLTPLLDTGVGSSTAPNGLSTPVPVDLNGDRIADVVYAGDLQGNLWKFDLAGDATAAPASWKVAFGGKPLFTARDASGRVQPITGRPGVARHPQKGVMVYFGTGKYYESGDNDPSQNLAIESFYGIWDKGAPVIRDDLKQQKITGEMVKFGFGVRTTTKVGSGGDGGWYMDLAFPDGQKSGERVVSTPLLRHGRVIFPTITPSNIPCGNGSSWLMELDAITGGRLEYTAFDVDKDKEFDKDDYETIVEDGKTVDVPVSGLRLDAIIDTPGVIQGETSEIKFIVNPDGSIHGLLENIGPNLRSGRRSWRQLQ